MIAIALPMTILMACGGGGGGGTAAAPTVPPTNMPGMDDQMTTPIIPPSVGNAQALPSYQITDVSTALTTTNGTALNLTREQIVQALRMRADGADTLEVGTLYADGGAGFSASGQHTPTCSGTSCSVTLPDVGDIRFSLDEIYDPALINDAGLEGYNVGMESVMTDNGVMLVQGIGAARGDGETPFTFQTYAGWIDDSAFGVERIEITATNTNVIYASYSFGNVSGTNPEGTGTARWSGIIVARERGGGVLNHGDVNIDIDDLDNPDVDISFTYGRLDGQTSSSGNYDNMPLNDGTFESNGGAIKGSFYGDDHGEVGGIWDDTNFIGAFGATRQP